MPEGGMHNDDDVGGPPRHLRLAGLAVLGIVTAGGLYLIAVRGPAMVMDLYAASKLFLCF